MGERVTEINKRKEEERFYWEEQVKLYFGLRKEESIDVLFKAVPEEIGKYGAKRQKVELDLKEGSRLPDRLPRDAWEKWCKEGVVCFCLGSHKLQRVYFANPRDLSVYHVVDFVYSKYNLIPRLHSVGCVLLGSKIYIIGGWGYRSDPTTVYHCDVATQPQLSDGGYEWIPGLDLSSGKRTPYVFSLADNIYVLSVDNPEQPFEVLKSGRTSWEVLAPPPPPLWTGEPPEYAVTFAGSHTIDGKKIFLLATPGCVGSWTTPGNDLFMYDSEDDKWTLIEYRKESPATPLALTTIYCFHLEHGDFFSDETRFPFPGLDLEFLSSEVFGPPFHRRFPPSLLNVLHLSGKRVCIIALFTDYDDDNTRGPSCFAQVATLDLTAYSASDYSYSYQGELLKKTRHSYSVTNLKMKTIPLHDDASLLPYELCSKM